MYFVLFAHLDVASLMAKLPRWMDWHTAPANRSAHSSPLNSFTQTIASAAHTTLPFLFGQLTWNIFTLNNSIYHFLFI